MYVGPLPTSLPTPPKQLAGVARVTLRPGESRRVSVTLDPLALSYWDVVTNRWVMPGGEVPILVGSSSRTILLRGMLQVAPH